MTARVFALPWDVVQDRVKSGKGRAEFMSENLLLGMVQSQHGTGGRGQGELSADLAGGVLGMRYAMDNVLPLNPVVAEVYGEYIDANQVEKDGHLGRRAR